MTKVVVNRCFGGFELSKKGIDRYANIKDIELHKVDHRGFAYYITIPYEEFTELSEDEQQEYYWGMRHVDRDDEALIQVVEELGEEANGPHASLEVVEVPDSVDWYIDEYDGKETIREKHRTW